MSATGNWLTKFGPLELKNFHYENLTLKTQNNFPNICHKKGFSFFWYGASSSVWLISTAVRAHRRCARVLWESDRGLCALRPLAGWLVVVVVAGGLRHICRSRCQYVRNTFVRTVSLPAPCPLPGLPSLIPHHSSLAALLCSGR